MKPMHLLSTSATLAGLAAAGLLGRHMLETKDDNGGGASAPPEVKSALGFQHMAANDARLAEIAAKGAADPLTEQKLAAINSAMDETQKKVDAMLLDMKRPQLSLDAKGQPMTEAEAKHRAAFGDFMRKGVEDGLGDLQAKALSVGVAADGGYAVPKVIDSNILSLAADVSPIRALATVVVTSTTDYRKLVNKHGAAANWQGETGTTADSGTPQLAEIAPPSGWLEARPRVTQQLLDDAMFDVEGWLADEVALAFAIAEGAAFINGNGVNKPRGFLAGAAPVATDDAGRAFGTLQFVASGGAAALPTTGDPYITLVYKLKAMHRGMANWVTNRATLAEMRKLKDGNNQYLWQPGLQAGQPSSFLGYGVTEAEDMPAVAANAFPLAFGNFKAGYLINDRFGVRVLRDPFTAKPYVEFYTTKRVGGAVVDSEAIKLMKISV
jgi:HK97 family phage major capsid protein